MIRLPLDKVTILPDEFLPDDQELYLFNFLNLKKNEFENDNIDFLREAPEVDGLVIMLGELSNFKY
jgi:hypothetical protein